MQLNDFAEEDIDSCDTGLITSDGEEINEGTVGDALCERMFNFTYPTEAERKVWYAKRWSTGAGVCRKDSKACIERKEKEGVIIGAYHSYCGTDWQEVATGTGKARKTLDLERPLCCFKSADPVCKDGKVIKAYASAKGLAKKPNEAEGETCETHPFKFGCPCPELPIKPKYWPCRPGVRFNRVCEKKK